MLVFLLTVVFLLLVIWIGNRGRDNHTTAAVCNWIQVILGNKSSFYFLSFFACGETVDLDNFCSCD